MSQLRRLLSDKDARARLCDPAFALPAFAKIVDQQQGRVDTYDPYRITKALQPTIIKYYSDPPKTAQGQTEWLVLVGPRQAGKSLLAELCGYVKTAYNPGYEHICIADNRDRATYLHQRVHLTHTNWPEEIRSPTEATRESRQLTFDSSIGGRMRVLSGESGAVGIGRSPDSFHGSELPWWTDAATQFSMIFPSMVNRDNCLMCLESTPAPKGFPSTPWFQDICHDAKLRKGRWTYKFFPFWDSLLNTRPWDRGNVATNEELNLLNRYGPLGMTLDNLAFRRFLLDSDPEIRRNPDLFQVYYPSDDVSCWLDSAGGVIHRSLIERHLKGTLYDKTEAYMVFERPQLGAQYAIGVDPAGYAARDHAAFQVLKVYDGEWTQVACFADTVDPVEFTALLLKVAEEYNNAWVGVESNGVGAAVIAMIQQSGYKHLHYESKGKPGLTTTSKSLERMLGWLCDALRDELVLFDKDTISQLLSYRQDKVVEGGVISEMLRGGKVGKGRRERHHWDKISALMMGISIARTLFRREKSTGTAEELTNVIPFRDMSYDDIVSYRKQEEERKNRLQTRGKSRYRSVRKPRR